MSLIKNGLKILFENITESNRKTLIFNWESLKNESSWIPKILLGTTKIDEVKAKRVSREVQGHFEKGGLGFLQQLVIGDETWVHHYDPEYKDTL